MSKLSDSEIRKLCLNDIYHKGKPLITPFSEGVETGKVSYGLTSTGYDVRLAPKAYIFKNTQNLVVDPVCFKDEDYRKKVFDVIEDQNYHVLPPHSYGLFMAYEWVNIPRNISGTCVGKSTLARCGVLINTTPMEPEWSGHLTIEIANISPCPVKLYVMQGIAQFRFDLIYGDVKKSYAEKGDGFGGKYQNQYDITPAKILE